MSEGFILVSVVFALWFCFWLPASMAVSRGRSAVGWLFLTLVFSPVFTVLALLVLGPTVAKALGDRKRARGEP